LLRRPSISTFLRTAKTLYLSFLRNSERKTARRFGGTAPGQNLPSARISACTRSMLSRRIEIISSI
jgi:hypothetical protein